MSFETATRKQYRFPSTKGELNVEQLWQLPLQANSGFDLDTIAKAINRELKAQSEDSFVTPTNTAKTKLLEDKLAIVVHIINVKQAENAAAARDAEKRRQKQLLTEILHMRTQEDLMKKSPAEIRAMLDALDTP